MPSSPRFAHLDDVPWQEVRKQRHADGEKSVREKWLDFSPRFLSLYAKWDPGMIVQAHGHRSNHVVFVLDGEMTCGDVVCRKGMHIALEEGDTFGPFVAGADGVELFEVMMGDPRSWGDDPDSLDRLRAEHGVEPLPDVPLDFPPWLEDLRSQWSAGDGD